MNFVPPKEFPQDLFQEFGKCASELFPGPLSDQTLNDRLQRRHQFAQAWQAGSVSLPNWKMMRRRRMNNSVHSEGPRVYKPC